MVSPALTPSVLYEKPLGAVQFRDTKYFVSQQGEIFSRFPPYRRIPERFLRRVLGGNGHGYLKINIKGTSVGVHTMVCEAFHGPKSHRSMVANHINGIKTDNRAENLEWVTRTENQKHAYRTGLQKHHSQKLTVQQVLFIRGSVESNHSLARKYGVNAKTIRQIKRKEIWKHV